ncbi:anti-sigma factor family protein [Rhizohabitans arisaemae]|uniref:anti-sigma factor family protein n=1 Tax=Rhizohabitans arisaemae TaxID=2720610 RepID=UPI0024B16EC3|nr:zf-HC2 domain-containing protein [Rhizohabitans arisaemae]
MSHLGERVSALIDGELGHTEREKAFAHLAGCDDCRAEVDALRSLKNRLRSLAPTGIPADLTMSLLRMGEPGGPIPPRARPLPSLRGYGPADNRPPRAAAFTAPAKRKPGGGRARRVRYVAVGVASAAVALGTLFAIGGVDNTPGVVPPVEMFANQHKISVQEPATTVRPAP